MAEYFYQNYEPYAAEGRYSIWKEKNAKDRNKKDTLYRFRQGIDAAPDTLRNGLAPTIKNKKYVVKIVAGDLKKVDLKVLYNRYRVRPFNYHVNDSTMYFTMEPLKNYCELVIANDSNLRELLVMDCTYFPDYRTQQYFSYNFKQLPHIWGTYDKELPAEPVLFEKTTNEEFGQDSTFQLKIPTNLDKSSGNTLIITCRNSSNDKAPKKLTLSFGNSKGKKRTTVTMDIVKSDKEEKYAVRVSSIYKWHMNEVDEIGLKTDNPKDIKISKIQITKGS
jgi:hypothetical protein